jgi:hypothetical protein
MVESHSILELKPMLLRRAILMFVILAMCQRITDDTNESK